MSMGVSQKVPSPLVGEGQGEGADRRFTWGQQVIVENRAGANEIIGGDAVAKAKPDGYTLLALCSEQRATAFPATPTLLESGYPRLVMTGWTGLLAPAGTPPGSLTKLSRAVTRYLSTPEIRERMSSQLLRALC